MAMIRYLFLILVLLTAAPALSLDRARAADFVLFTQPKTGTHLMIPLLTALTGRKHTLPPWRQLHLGKTYPTQEAFEEAVEDPHSIAFWGATNVVAADVVVNSLAQLKLEGRFLVSHCPYTPNAERLLTAHGHRVFFVRRDPRDVVISSVYFNRSTYPQVMPIAEFGHLSEEEQISTVILGRHWSSSVHQQLELFTPWMNSPSVCVIEFENLVDPENYLEEMCKIADFLGVEASERELRRIYEESFGKGWTFRSGKTGAWREHFTPEHKQLFKDEAGDFLIQLGFESDNNW